MSRDSMTGVRGAHSHNASSALPKENGHAVPSTVQPNFPHPSEGNIPVDTPISSTSELTQTWVHLAKTFVLIFPIYALGYFECSFSWLLIGLVIFFWWRRNTGGKHSRLSRAFAFFEQEERSVTQSLTTSDLPPWVRRCDIQYRACGIFVINIFEFPGESNQLTRAGGAELSCKAVMEQLFPLQ